MFGQGNMDPMCLIPWERRTRRRRTSMARKTSMAMKIRIMEATARDQNMMDNTSQNTASTIPTPEARVAAQRPVSLPSMKLPLRQDTREGSTTQLARLHRQRSPRRPSPWPRPGPGHMRPSTQRRTIKRRLPRIRFPSRLEGRPTFPQRLCTRMSTRGRRIRPLRS